MKESKVYLLEKDATISTVKDLFDEFKQTGTKHTISFLTTDTVELKKEMYSLFQDNIIGILLERWVTIAEEVEPYNVGNEPAEWVAEGVVKKSIKKGKNDDRKSNK